MVIEDHRAFPQEHGSEATELLEEFRSACHKYYFAFSHATLGYKAQHERYGQFIEPANYENRISTGSSFPNAKQSPGRSTIAQMTQGEMLKGLEDGGLFERHGAFFDGAAQCFAFDHYQPAHKCKVPDLRQVLVSLDHST